jgi:hypothetical protein
VKLNYREAGTKQENYESAALHIRRHAKPSSHGPLKRSLAISHYGEERASIGARLHDSVWIACFQASPKVLLGNKNLNSKTEEGISMQEQSHSLGRRHAIGSIIAAVAVVVLVSLTMTAVAADGTQVRPGGPTPHQVLNGTAQLIGPFKADQKLRLVFGLQPPHMDEENQFLRAPHPRLSQLHAFPEAGGVERAFCSV